jgi:hypothetical protein
MGDGDFGTEVGTGGIDTTVIVKRVQDPRGVSDAITDAWVIAYDLPVSERDLARRAVKEIALNPETGYSEPYVLIEQHTEFEWGASAEGLKFVLEVVDSVPAELIAFGLGTAARKIAGALVPTTSRAPITLDAADDKARIAIFLVYGVQQETLTRVGDARETDGSQVEVTYRDAQGTTYTARVEYVGNIVLAVHVSRREP